MERMKVAIQLPAKAADSPAWVGIGISIIVPCWREDAVTDETAALWLASGLVEEVLIASVDGEPSATCPDRPGLRVVRCRRPGRGLQMNEAARLARGKMLFFHHADTELTEGHLLMEDVEFSCRLRRHAGGLTILSPAIGSSPRKHLQQGRWRTTLTNTALLLLYVLGVSPQRLHGWYYRPRRR